MFVKDCILIDAPKDLWIILTAIGYKPEYLSKFEYNLEGRNLVCENGYWHYTDSTNKPWAYNCKTNIELFLAIAEYRDDTDYMQLFKDNKGNHRKCQIPKNNDSDLTKMTLNEIIKLYKND